MTDSIYETIIHHAIDTGLYVVPCALERYAASVGGHVMNLVNIDHRMFKKGRTPANFRVHVCYFAPSGWTKSTYIRFLLRDKYGLLWNAEKFMPVDVHATFSRAAWLGTAKKNESTGEVDTCDGVLTQYKRGIIGADDYQALKLMFEGEGTDQDETALLTALDTDYAIKNLSMKNIRINNIGMSFWVGMRPCSIDMSKSGFARRFSFGYFVPNRTEAELFKRLARTEITCSYELEAEEYTPMMLRELETAYDTVREVGAVQLDFDEVNKFLGQFSIPHFEENIYRTLALGLSVARGMYPRIPVDDRTQKLLENEILNREIIKTDHHRMMFYKIISEEPDQTIKYTDLVYFLTTYLQYVEQKAIWAVQKETRHKRLTAQGVGKRKTITLNWEPHYLDDLKGDNNGETETEG